MGALMDTLLSDQRRLEEAAETIPGLLVMEFDGPATRSTIEFRLMADNAELRQMVEALQERNAVLAQRQATDATSIATAIKGLKHMTSDDARTIIAALSARLIAIQDIDNGECIDALDAAHAAEWREWQDPYAGQLDDRGVTGIKR